MSSEFRGDNSTPFSKQLGRKNCDDSHSLTFLKDKPGMDNIFFCLRLGKKEMSMQIYCISWNFWGILPMTEILFAPI